jgi:hypothetical protein
VPLEPSVRAELQRRILEEPERAATRARVALLAAEGLPDRTIAVIAGMHHNRVAVWRRRFSSLGLAGLEDAMRPGRPPARGEAQLLAAAGRPARRGITAGHAAAERRRGEQPDHEQGNRHAVAPHWRARRALERARDGSDVVSRLLAELDAGRRLVVVGVHLAPGASAVAVVSSPAAAVSAPLRGLRRRSASAGLLGFVLEVTRAWRGSGQLHVLVEQTGLPRRSGRPADGAGCDVPLRLYAAGGRPAWAVQAELIMVLAGQAGSDSYWGGLARLRDHARRRRVDSVLLVPAGGR